MQKQATPFLQGAANISILPASFVAKVGTTGGVAIDLFRVPEAAVAGPLLATLAYRRAFAIENGAFEPVSLGEDLAFVDRALLRCNKMLAIPLASVYVRHSANTWKWSAGHGSQLVKAPTPNWATSARLLDALEAAHDLSLIHISEPTRPY